MAGFGAKPPYLPPATYGFGGLLSFDQPPVRNALAPPAQTSLHSLASLGQPGLIGARLPSAAPYHPAQRGLGAIFALRQVAPPPPYNSAAAVAARFQKFLDNIALTQPQFADGETKLRTVTSCLNRAYWGHNDETRNRVLAGSWSKQTRVRPPRDIDMLFVLPPSVYNRFEGRFGNKQSQLLQEVKQALIQASPRTEMRGDGQVVMVNFESYAVEVAPAFLLNNNTQYWICDTNDGGRYKVADPAAESSNIVVSDQATNGNARRLTRMMKKWQKYCSVPLKSFWIELLAVDFLRRWQYRVSGYPYHDWMVRDFLAFLLGCRFTPLVVPGTFEVIWLGDDWFSKATTAYGRAKRACELESGGYPYSAGAEWQAIFGPDFPV